MESDERSDSTEVAAAAVRPPMHRGDEAQQQQPRPQGVFRPELSDDDDVTNQRQQQRVTDRRGGGYSYQSHHPPAPAPPSSSTMNNGMHVGLRGNFHDDDDDDGNSPAASAEADGLDNPGLDISSDDIEIDDHSHLHDDGGTRPSNRSGEARSDVGGSGRDNQQALLPPPSVPTSSPSRRVASSGRQQQQASSPDDAPASAWADVAATLPAPSLSVEAIDGLIANADNGTGTAATTTRSRATKKTAPAGAVEVTGGSGSPLEAFAQRSDPHDRPRQPAEAASRLQQQQQQQQPRPNPAAIVRSIASYLSLSDAESIGSLACTPYGTTIGGAATPHSAYSSASRRSRYSHSSGGGGGGNRRNARSRGRGGSGGSGSLGPPSSLILDHSCTAVGSEDPDDADHDDADAAAGGICSSAGRTPAGGILLRSTTGNSTGGGSVSWAGGDGLTPSAPGLVSLGEEDGEEEDDEEDEDVEEEESAEDVAVVESPFDEHSMNVFRRQQRKILQQKLTAAVMSHPHSIRSYCLEAQKAAEEMKQQRLKLREERMGFEPEDAEDALVAKKRQLEQRQRVRILRAVLNGILSNVPLSVMLDLAEAAFETSLDTTVAAFKVTAVTVDGTVSVLASAVSWSFDAVSTLNPFVVVGTIFALQRDAAYHATDALVTGIQSVATGVGSAGTLTMHTISALSKSGGGHSSAGGGGQRSGGGGIAGSKVGSVVGIAEQAQFGSASRFLSRMNLLRGTNATNKNNALSEKLYRKLSRVDSSSRVVAYMEREDDVISQHARKRVQRMMHYHVSLRPFVATVSAPRDKSARASPATSFHNVDFPGQMQTAPPSRQNSVDMEANSLSSADDDSEPFMCTPKSFPPTPTSRSDVLARGFRFSEDVVFLARDQLRLQGGLESDNPQTRAMARALKEGSRLAVFNTSDSDSGVALTCGQHVATKTGNDLYCSTRSMVPVLRNSYVYFEMSVSSPPMSNMMIQPASVSVGLSTVEMPLNALVGAWKGSIGLCTTGQILAAGQWCSPLDPRVSAYGSDSTVGCLVCLDDDSAFETWDGTMVTALITFNVNGQVVLPHSGNNALGSTTGSNEQQQQQQQVSNTAPNESSTVPLFVPREEELYATLTLHSPDTQVLCRFCAEDILARSRKEIGAPEGVTIYAVDGGVLLSDYVNELEQYSSSRDEENDSDDDGSLDSITNYE
mmetsp:Transcript_25626/g.55475  ORF Transcript_25626/g.55475 Transcript_25626/m.55475 type:complete len:1193 (+) Transcript_25626:51-3629(+)